MMLLMTMMRTGKIVGGILICHRMDTVEMKAFRMMENREDAAVAVGVLMSYWALSFSLCLHLLFGQKIKKKGITGSK